MFRKLKNIISHPSVLGIYFMDHWYTVLGWWFTFFVFTSVILAVADLGTRRMDGNTAISLSDQLVYGNYINDAYYENNELNGRYVQITTDYFIISFNDNAFMNNRTNGLVIVFGKDNVNMFYSGIHLGKEEYKNLKIADFSIQKIKEGNVEMRMAFESFLLKGLEAGEANFRAVCFFNDLFSVLMYYALTLLMCYIAGWVSNPPIESRFRIKLAAYASFVYFIFVWFSILFQVSWLLYVGMFFALVYTIMTFSHIRKVKVGRRGL